MRPLTFLGAGILIAAVSGAAAAPDLTVPLPPEPPPVSAEMFRSETVDAAPAKLPMGRSRYLALLTQEAERQGLPPAVADAVAVVESGYDPNAVGGVGEVGLMQVLPTTAQMLGFRGPTRDLFEPGTNVRLGVTYLAQAWRMTDGNLCETLMKYRAGHGETRFSPLSVGYCIRARRHLAAIGSPLAAAPVPEAVAIAVSRPPPPAGAAVRPNARTARTRAASRRLWAAHDARMKAIQGKVTTSSLSIMAR